MVLCRIEVGECSRIRESLRFRVTLIIIIRFIQFSQRYSVGHPLMQDRGSQSQRARSWESLGRESVGGVCTGWTQFLLMVPAERELLLLVVGRLTPSLPTILVTAPLVHWQFSLSSIGGMLFNRDERFLSKEMQQFNSV